MTVDEAMSLKPGDLVYLSGKSLRTYKGLVLEYVSSYHKRTTSSRGQVFIDPCPTLILKQPGYDLGFRHEVRFSMISRYEES